MWIWFTCHIPSLWWMAYQEWNSSRFFVIRKSKNLVLKNPPCTAWFQPCMEGVRWNSLCTMSGAHLDNFLWSCSCLLVHDTKIWHDWIIIWFNYDFFMALSHVCAYSTWWDQLWFSCASLCMVPHLGCIPTMAKRWLQSCNILKF